MEAGQVVKMDGLVRSTAQLVVYQWPFLEQALDVVHGDVL